MVTNHVPNSYADIRRRSLTRSTIHRPRHIMTPHSSRRQFDTTPPFSETSVCHDASPLETSKILSSSGTHHRRLLYVKACHLPRYCIDTTFKAYVESWRPVLSTVSAITARRGDLLAGGTLKPCQTANDPVQSPWWAGPLSPRWRLSEPPKNL